MTMNQKKFTFFSLSGWVVVMSLCLGFATAEAQITEKPQYGTFLIENVDIYPVTSEMIEGGVVMVKDGVIEYVGSNVKPDLTSDVIRIDGSGHRLYPGFIDSETQLGLNEIGAVAVTIDAAEVGSVNPEMIAQTAVNPGSVSIPVTRVDGVTNVVAAPVSGLVSGTGSLIDLYGYTPEAMSIDQRAGIYLNWPSSGKRGWWDSRSQKEIDDDYKEAIDQINDLFDDARAYHAMWQSIDDGELDAQPDVHAKMDAMRYLFTQEARLVVRVNREKDILAAVDWATQQEDLSFVFSGVSEGWRVADQLAEADIPVIATALVTPSRSSDHYARPYQNAGLMAQAGVHVSLSTFNTENVRNLPFHAGYAATYGMGVEEALKAVTINPAELWGVEDKLGSIEVGKHANLILVDGDPFETTSMIKDVFIRGYRIPMVSRHTQLNEEFLDRDATN
jgi:imidazolonepropionase-like amidohydrolase